MKTYNANFKTDQALYDKFKVVCTINGEKIGEKLTHLMQNYVSENEKLLENPHIEQKISPQMPEVFGKPKDWYLYIKQTDEETFSKLDTRIHFLKALVNDRIIIDSQIKTPSTDRKLFMDTDDYKYLVKTGRWDVLEMNSKTPL